MSWKSFVDAFARLVHQCLTDCNEHETVIRFERTPDGKIKRVDRLCRGSTVYNRTVSHTNPVNVIYDQTSCFSHVANDALEAAIEDGLRNNLFTHEQVAESRKRCRNC